MGKYIKQQKEIELMAEGGAILADVLYRTGLLVAPGISTAEINAFAETGIRKAGGRPSFIGYGPKKNPFPAGLCISVNDEVVHGIPSQATILHNGDIVGLDIGMEYRGFFTDHAITVPVGTVTPLAQQLIAVTQRSLTEAIKQMRPGNRMGDIGFAVQSVAEHAGFSVVRDLVGHGVGYAVHEDPNVPCYGKQGTGIMLELAWF